MSLPKYFHYTAQEFSPGDRLEPQEDGYTQWEESRALEAVLERYRPADKLPRSQSVFLFKGPVTNSESYGADCTTYLCAVASPNNPEDERSDLSWLKELDQGFDDVTILEEDFTEAELRFFAEGYWSGTARPDAVPVYEYRVPYADVKLCLETESYLSRKPLEPVDEHSI